MIDIAVKEKGIILDFFSGSATTAHAVMQKNAEDGGNRKFIMVQLPEETPSDSESAKAGYENIAQLGRERISRAAEKIKTDYADRLAERENPLDTGFRTYKIDDTNMKDVFYHPTEVDQATIDGLVDNVKEDRSAEDLLTQLMLDLGLTLDLPIETKTIASNTVFCVGGNALVACLDTKLTDEAIDEIANLEPLKVVLRDATFGAGGDRDQNQINIKNRFKELSPDTVINII
jgi:adenine-specific DNA-methyltransferase